MTTTSNNPVRIIQITDTHLYEEPEGTLARMNTQDSFRKVLDLVKTNEKEIDLILATGDIAQDASEDAYGYFMTAVGETGVPFRWIPGNHDIASVMEDVAEGTNACDKSTQLGNWLILTLDYSIVGQVHGRLDPEEIEFLKSSLSAATTSSEIENILITLHHNPVPGTAGWMKDIGLENPSELFDALKMTDKVRGVLYAHIHQELDFNLQNIRYMCTPSTCIQFKPQVTNFTLDRLNPGYRSLQLFADGKIETAVFRVTGFDLEADFSSAGY